MIDASSLAQPAAFCALGVALLLAVVISHRRLSRALRRPPAPSPRLDRYPSVTVVRPIRGLDTGARENAAALLRQEYPGPRETLFILDTEDDPAHPVMVDAVEDWLSRGGTGAEVLVAGPPPPERTGKLQAMMLGEARARGELVVFCDSDTRPDAHLLRVLVEEIVARPRAGCVFAPVVARSDETRWPDVAYELLVNAWYGPSAAVAAGELGELPFVMGQIMVVRRSALEAIGGVRCAEGQFVDDMHIGREIAKVGLSNVMVPYPLRIVTGGLDGRQFLRVFRRWILFADGGLPRRFVLVNWLRGALHFASIAGAVGALATSAWWAALAPAAAAAALVWSQLSLQRRAGGAPVSLGHLWVPAILPILSAFVALSTKLDREVDWRGRRYVLDGAAKLARGLPAGRAET